MPFKITLWPSCSPNTVVLCINKRHESPREEQHLHLMGLPSLCLCSSSRHLLILAWAVIDGQLLAAFGCLPSKFGQLFVPEL